MGSGPPGAVLRNSFLPSRAATPLWRRRSQPMYDSGKIVLLNEEREELPQRHPRFQRVPEVGARDDLVAVASPGLGPDDEALADEFGDDLLDGALGDADPLGEVPDPGLRVAGDRDEHVPVVRQEGPSVVTGHGGMIGER